MRGWISEILRFGTYCVLAISLSLSTTSLAKPRKPLASPKQPAAPDTQLNRATPQIDTIAIVSSETLTAIGRLDTAADRAGQGMGVGAAGGGASGALIGATACSPAGPLGSLLCAMIAGSIGMVAGGVAGTIYGMTGVSDTDALYINEILSYLDQQRNLQDELALRIRNHLPLQVQVSAERADALVVATLTRIHFTQKSKEQISFTAKASMTLLENSDLETLYQTTSEFTTNSTTANIEEWLAVDGTKLESAIDGVILDLSKQIVTELIKLTSGELQ